MLSKKFQLLKNIYKTIKIVISSSVMVCLREEEKEWQIFTKQSKLYNPVPLPIYKYLDISPKKWWCMRELKKKIEFENNFLHFVVKNFPSNESFSVKEIKGYSYLEAPASKYQLPSEVIEETEAYILKEKLKPKPKPQPKSKPKSKTGETGKIENPFTMEISQEDAEKILNVSHDATEEEILERYTKIFEQNNPEEGGSLYLQAKVIAAKNTLLSNRNKKIENENHKN
jgi:hypothetical protein